MTHILACLRNTMCRLHTGDKCSCEARYSYPDRDARRRKEMMLLRLDCGVRHFWHVLVKHVSQKLLFRGHQDSRIYMSGVWKEARVLREDKMINGSVQNEEHTYNKHQKVTKRSLCVLRNSVILRRQFFIVDERKKLLRFQTVSDDLHLGKGRSGQGKLEEPEDPRHGRHSRETCVPGTNSQS